MRSLLLVLFAVTPVTQACASSASKAQPADAGEVRVLACPPANDAGIASAADAGVTAKILKPANGDRFKTTEKVSFQGMGSDPNEGAITDPTRMIWNIGDPVKGISPDGEGPADTAGPYPAGTYLLRFDVSNKACLTNADSVTITVE